MNIDAICHKITSTETLNALHACRKGHPLGHGKERAVLWNDAWFLVPQHLGVSSEEANWLNKKAINCLGT